ncbi:hypothetical protein PoB_003867500 [Plakobranchus ocellatus]|uniref:Uncharacterized protein n=1 Tax=Plakobranchus ocellatus TaxID=259542 RepID=A0AAV4AY31_9GAST|nr:hypothetical protein PoB_003867500 [Plakobranchus ocellatus]
MQSDMNCVPWSLNTFSGTPNRLILEPAMHDVLGPIKGSGLFFLFSLLCTHKSLYCRILLIEGDQLVTINSTVPLHCRHPRGMSEKKQEKGHNSKSFDQINLKLSQIKVHSFTTSQRNPCGDRCILASATAAN